MNETGMQKAAILMLALGEIEASEVMRFLGPREVLKLGAAMANMKGIAHEQVVTVLDSFIAYLSYSSNSSYVCGHSSFTKTATASAYCLISN